MLDADLIKFVEPIGPGQIVDRESLVALPTGQIQMTIETNEKEVTVRVLEMRGPDDFAPADYSPASSWNVSAYIWQNGQVIVAEKLPGRPVLSRSRTLPRFGTMARRRVNLATRTFRFEREQAASGTEDSVVDAILQICVYKSLGNAIQRKAFLGTVHIALNYLTSSEHQGVEDEAVCTKEWFKVFPKSTFLPGCPSSIAKANCAISGEQKQPSKTPDPQPESRTPVGSPDARSHLTVSFSQYRLDRSNSTSSTSISAMAERKETLPRTSTDPNPKKTQLIASWVKRKILRQASIPLTMRQRTPDSARCSQPPDLAPVIVGPRRRIPASVSAPAERSIAEASPSSVTIDEKCEFLPVPERWTSAKGCISKSVYRASRSNNSSFDVGYESSRNSCLSSSDEESPNASAESNLDALSEKSIAVAIVHRTADEFDRADRATGNQDTTPPPSTCRKTMQKQRASLLRRTKRITEDGGFTALNEIRRLDSRGSQDSALSSYS